MKNILPIIFFLAICLSSYSQEKLKKKIEKHKNPHYTETYYIIKGRQEVKHGAYVRTSAFGRTQEKGQFENNSKVGVWEYFDYSGKLEQKYNHSTSTIELDKSETNELVYFVLKDGVFVESKLDSAPVFIGGQSRLLRSTGSQLNYPTKALRSGTQGKVYISVTINENGEQVNEEIIKGIGKGCDQEALRMMKLVPDDWIPAKIGRESVLVKFELSVSFKLWDN